MIKTVIDTSTLISLARISYLELLQNFTSWRGGNMLKAKELIRTNIMLDREVLKTIDEFAKKMAEDRSTVIRHLIKKAITGEKIDLAVKKLQEGAPFRKAAEIADLDYWDFQTELDKRGIPVSTSIPFGRRRIRQ